MAERGYTLAQGDRRAFVAVDFRGQVFAIAKWSAIKTKEVRGRLETLKDVPGVDQAKAAIAARMTEALRGYIREAETAHQKQAAALAMQRAQLVQKQRKERADLAATQEQRWTRETTLRASRLNKGVRDLWDRITGRHARQAKENEREALAALQRDRREKDALIVRHIDKSEIFHLLTRQQKQAYAKDMEQLHQDIAAYMQVRQSTPQKLRDSFYSAVQERESSREPPKINCTLHLGRGL